MTKSIVNGRAGEPLYAFRKPRMRHEMVKWIADSDYSHGITLTIDREVSLPTLKDMCGDFFLEVDRFKHRRRNVQNIASVDRFQAIGFPEHLESNLHLHFAGKPDGWLDLPFSQHDQEILARNWRKISKSGSIDFKEIYDLWGWADYITKEYYKQDGKFVLSQDFHPNRFVLD